MAHRLHSSLIVQKFNPLTTTVGYPRVSTFEQLRDLPRDALKTAGCHRIFTDTANGGRSDRSGLQQALAYVREGDVLVVWRLDRLGRSLEYLIEIITTLNERGVGFRSLTEQIDTTTSGGKFIFQVFGALAAFERDIIRERTQAELAAVNMRPSAITITPSLMAARHALSSTRWSHRPT